MIKVSLLSCCGLSLCLLQVPPSFELLGEVHFEVNELPLCHVASTEEKAREEERVELLRGRGLVWVCVEQVETHRLCFTIKSVYIGPSFK